jgi:hypothetical protein
MSINPVHEFFDESNGDARCPVDGYAFSTKTRNPTNLINQLRKHKDRFADYEQNKSALDDLRKSQPKIPFLVEQKRSTQKENSGGQSALALLARKRSLSYRLVDLPEFKDYIQLVSQTRGYSLPCRQTLRKKVQFACAAEESEIGVWRHQVNCECLRYLHG